MRWLLIAAGAGVALWLLWPFLLLPLFWLAGLNH